MALPFLPGNVFNKNIGKDRFHKSHYLNHNHNVGYVFGDDKPGIGGEMLPGQRFNPEISRFPSGSGPRLPAWVAFDKQVLSFDGYFQEAVHERQNEQYRIRQCKVLFYLEDDSIQVIEPRIKNSGISQGTIVRRHRIPKQPLESEEFYTIHDFNVGIEIVIYGKRIRIVSCDQFTNNFLRKMGVRVGEPEPIPADQYTEMRNAIDESLQPLRPYERFDKLRSFLDHDRHVLRFYCFWDDTDTLYGDAREMVLHYFLSDDTIEIREVIPINSGRDATPCFLKRQKLPKGVTDLPLPGAMTDRTLLNVSFHPQSGNSFLLDNLKIGAQKIEYYTDKELIIGSTLNVYGRKFLICDCDEFTKEYYRTKYGISTFTPVETNKHTIYQSFLQTNPPYNGWGSDEDSLANCKGLIPVPPQKDFLKFMEKDRQGLESHILRFVARLVSNNPLERCRCFIICCYLSDDTFMVYESAQRNSGFMGGKFMEKKKMLKPGQERWRTDLPEYYKSTDVFVGARLNFNDFEFEIIAADEYAHNYMEKHPAEYPVSDLNKIQVKLRPLVQDRCEDLKTFAHQQDPDERGSIDYSQFEHLINCIVHDPRFEPVSIVPHEVATLARYYAERQPIQIDYVALLTLAQQQLRKAGFEAFQELEASCKYEDCEKTGLLKQSDVRRICLSHRLPLPDDMLRVLMGISEDTENGQVKYEHFIKQLNWRCAPLEKSKVLCEFSGNLDVDWFNVVTGQDPSKSLDCESYASNRQIVKRVRYEAFIEDLCKTRPCS